MARPKKAQSGMVTNVSKNPIQLPDGRMIAAGETLTDVDESSLDGNLFVTSGWLAVGKDSKVLQSQIDASSAERAELEARIADLEDQLNAATLRANEAEAKLSAPQE